MAENHINLVNTGQTIKHHMGWSDYNDLATQSTPIALPTANTFVPLTNDGQGPNSNKAHAISDHGTLWDVDNQHFDFSPLQIGDTVDIRIDVEYDLPSANTVTFLEMQFGIGTPSSFSLPVDSRYWKTAGLKRTTRWYGFYIGSDLTRNNPAKLRAATDGAGASIKVNGWYVRTWARN